MKITEFAKKEITGWKSYEVFIIIFAFLLIIYNAIVLHDSVIAVCSAFFGILYTIIAGKGKISCYFFGLMGSGCYVYLSAFSHLWGNALLYLAYYIPMQIHGIFAWKSNLNNDFEIKKTGMTGKQKLKFLVTGILGSILTALILYFMNDKNPVIDGITTFLSILGMYCTVKRFLEQWIIWIIVNGLSFFMWLNLIIHGTKAYSTLVMWGVYFVLAIYFYEIWKKELINNNNSEIETVSQ
ncbi:nicotinamide mononucleotide transporter [bacterium]|nr:nicotinamide mononucleotide transporter [bacterium]